VQTFQLICENQSARENDRARDSDSRAVATCEVTCRQRRRSIPISIVHSCIVGLVEPLHTHVEEWSLVLDKQCQQEDRNVEWNKRAQFHVKGDDLVSVRVHSATHDLIGLAECFNLLWLQTNFTVELLCCFLAQTLLVNQVTRLLNLFVGREEEQRVVAFKIAHEATLIRVLVILFCECEGHESRLGSLLRLNLLLSKCLGNCWLGHCELRRVKLRQVNCTHCFNLNISRFHFRYLKFLLLGLRITHVYTNSIY
jgi:hypothetical protein